MQNTPLLMGVVNVTPDSFSDGGRFFDPQAAIAHGVKLMDEGAAILDIGGESTRPGATPVTPQEEMARVLPVLQGLARHAETRGVALSIDTRHAATMQAALDAGAAIINDVSALTHDPDAMNVAARCRAKIVLMHMQGTPQTMQHAPHYADVVREVRDYFQARMEACAQVGIARERLILDPGIGFGKSAEHNLALLKNIAAFSELGAPILVGASRKSFIGKLTGTHDPQDRLAGSLAIALYAATAGAAILRVHDVKETRQALVMQGLLSN